MSAPATLPATVLRRLQHHSARVVARRPSWCFRPCSFRPAFRMYVCLGLFSSCTQPAPTCLPSPGSSSLCSLRGGGGGIPCGGKYESTNSGTTKPVPFLTNERTNDVWFPMIAHEKQWGLVGISKGTLVLDSCRHFLVVSGRIPTKNLKTLNKLRIKILVQTFAEILARLIPHPPVCVLGWAATLSGLVAYVLEGGYAGCPWLCKYNTCSKGSGRYIRSACPPLPLSPPSAIPLLQ